MEAMERNQSSKQYTIEVVCKSFDFQRDAYYKYKARKVKSDEKSAKILNMVKARRVELPREGCRKLHESLGESFEKQGLKIGRDCLLDLLRKHGMLVYKKRSFVKTTDSNHPFHKYKNMIKDLYVTGINQVWVSDITYIRLVKGHCYLALITDVYSRKIVGFDVSDSLELAGCLRALKMALKTLPRKHKLIHHSDRGSQYCSYAYTDELKEHKVRISMTEENHCYENAMAERVNGILKDEFYLDQCFDCLDFAAFACKNAIKLYNTKRLHLSLNYRTPEQVYRSAA
jgi:putative transposase